MVGYVARMTNDPDLADEVFAVTFARFFETLPRYKPCGKLASYLLRIAHNALHDELTRRARHGPLPPLGGGDAPAPADPAPGPAERAEVAEEGERARLALARLRRRCGRSSS